MLDGKLRYRRVVLKVSGEALGESPERAAEPTDVLFSQQRFRLLAGSIAGLRHAGVEVVVVVGGGNVFRGSEARRLGMRRGDADAIGMLATVMNGMVLASALRGVGEQPLLFAPRGQQNVAPDVLPWSSSIVLDKLSMGAVALVVGGIGLPFVSSDFPAVHCGIDLGCDAVLMGKHDVNGLYDADPKVDPEARLLPELPASEALRRRLAVMDLAALELALEYRMPVHTFAASDYDAALAICRGRRVGSVITPL